MLTPKYLQGCPDSLLALYAQAEEDILADMARRINAFDLYIPSTDFQHRKLEEMGMMREEILEELSKRSGKTKRELQRIMRDAGVKTMASDDKVYKAAGLIEKTGEVSPAMRRTIAAGMKKTNGVFTNLTKTTAKTATKQFERALDRAYMQVTSEAIDPTTAVRSAVKSLAREGVQAIRYPTGHVDSIDVAVRRAVITGVNQTALKVQEARMDELEVDLVETSAHAGARPEHAEWQGQIFSRSGRSSRYPDFVSSTGYGTGAGLGGWNCSHSFRPYIEGFPRAYTEETLRQYEARDIDYDGKKLTEYEAIQEQRGIERGIRRWKREVNALDAIGEDTSEASKHLRAWNAKQQSFLSKTGLKRNFNREQP